MYLTEKFDQRLTSVKIEGNNWYHGSYRITNAARYIYIGVAVLGSVCMCVFMCIYK